MRLRDVGSGPSLSISRRRWLTQSAAAAAGAIAVASSSVAARAMWAQAPQKFAPDDPVGGGVSHDAEAIHQQVTLPVSAAKIYDVLTTADLFQKMSLFSTDVPAAMLTAHPAQLSAEPGSTFSLFGGIIEGRQIELVPAKRVVQAWRVNSWDAGVYSIARFELNPHDATTMIVFDHTGFPKGMADHLARGWKEHYWDGLAKLLLK
jgi:activator of HSP90 ATPase